MEQIIRELSSELEMPVAYVQNVVLLIDEGNTIPFIARYRKEAHGSADDTVLRKLEERLKYLRNLSDRKEEVKKTVNAQGKLTDEIAGAISKAATLAEIEDIYRPFKQKRRTRASIAKAKGLESFADAVMKQDKTVETLNGLAAGYIDEEKGVDSIEDVFAGASGIIAETISDSPDIRKKIAEYIRKNGSLVSAATGTEDSVYAGYYDFIQPVRTVHGHQVLAVNRGEKEGMLKVSIDADETAAMDIIGKEVIVKGSRIKDLMSGTIADAYGRLLFPSIERMIRSELTEAADDGAIDNFAINLKSLLMQPPVRGHVTMGLDPGYRNGCKVAVIDPNGAVLDTTVVYPTFGGRQKREAIDKLSRMVKKHRVEHIAIGNGTASRETEMMAAEMIKELDCGLTYMVVNEAGASVYSASELAAKEFPDYDVNLRSAVSIARRLQDPLAELVKIDPKAIGVGQYQHDMPQKRLGESLTYVVEDCVNAVGVDLNTASAPLLTYISGLSPAIAENVVEYRNDNGTFTNRKQLLKVKKLGPKAFEQSAGFLRISGSSQILDNTGVHPESYDAANALLKCCGYTTDDVMNRRISDLSSKVGLIGEKKIAERCGIGVPTLHDIVAELLKPGRDPRDELMKPILRSDVMSIEDLKPGMRLKGTVRNVIDFGAFVDIGVHQDGLVHISEIADRYIKHPSDVLSVGVIVDVVILGIDEKKGRISLSIKQA